MDSDHPLQPSSPHDDSDDRPSEMTSETPPPAVHVEPEVPDPFIVDDGSDDDDSDSDGGGTEQVAPHAALEEADETPAAEDEIALAQSMILDPAALNVDKPVPPPPDEASGAAGGTGLAYDDDNEDEEDEDDEPPELYLPGLILPTMFLPIPNVRSHLCCGCGGVG